ncbi:MULTISPECIES: GIY-YIG nuclease family protein [Acidithiobacillus]|uniref:Bacteriophage T5 Orf172 DNA-binding domain-containing protein n=1 Tax=Acidithiobacillus ferrooxidans TaxID=920 RepID=A0A2W1KI65_ACIFR|nr:GIY-YIG nuclease family protein [Acidithiobacillus sp. MC2.2]PZD82122.1 hypothetical protein DN052_03570 [Acidithiobacillus ferrooxidans]UBU63242.1 GIY-YIG nuclease family protein [Acidithiobacillus ferrooxidans]
MASGRPKIGETVNLDQRMRNLSQGTGDPEKFSVVYSKRFTEVVLAESHRQLRSFGHAARCDERWPDPLTPKIAP